MFSGLMQYTFYRDCLGKFYALLFYYDWIISNNGLAYSLLKRNCYLYLTEVIPADLLMN